RAKPAKPKSKSVPKAKALAGGAIMAPAADPLPILREHYGGQVPWLLGWRAAAAWGRGGVGTSQRMIEALRHSSSSPAAPGAGMRAAGLGQVRLFSSVRVKARGAASVSSPWAAMEGADGARCVGPTAGVVQFGALHGSAVWRAAGAGQTAKGGPWARRRQLAA